MILAKRVGVLYDRCSSIEIKDFSQNIIKTFYLIILIKDDHI